MEASIAHYFWKQRPSRISVPARCHPLAKVVFREMARQGVTYDELEFRTSVLKSTFKAWRTNNRPGLETMEAALGGLGWRLLPVPSLASLPAPLRSRLKELGAEWEDLDAVLCGLIAAVVHEPRPAPSTPPRARPSQHAEPRQEATS